MSGNSEPVLLYHWNFTGANDLEVDDIIYDSESNLVAKLKERSTITSSTTFSRGSEGITLNNNDGENGGYYIDLEGLNTIQFGGNLSIEMAVQNHKRDFKAVYFLSVGEDNETNQAFINARFNGNPGKDKMFFGVRTDEKNDNPSIGVSYVERKISEENSTVINSNDEHHYIFSFNYDSSGSSVKLYIDGDKKGENDADLEKALTTNARSTNFIGTRKVEGSGVTYLNGVVKYLKIYQNSMSDSKATSIYNNYNTSPYFSNISSGTNENKYSRRHTDVISYFTNNSSVTSFSISGNQLGLSNSSEDYKVHKFTSGETIEISDKFNYIPLQGLNQFIILQYNSTYFKVTQTSIASNQNAKYKCEVSLNNTDNFTLECENKGFGDTFDYGNFQIVFGGVEFINNNNEICFHEDTLINTDQGKIKIKDLKSSNTIKNSKIVYLIKSEKKYKHLVLIEKNALGINLPSDNIIITKSHLIFINNKLIPISKLVNNKTIRIIENENSNVYNMILVDKNLINVNNLYLNVFGISNKYFNELEKLKKEGRKNKIINFSPDSKINLDFGKFLEF